MSDADREIGGLREAFSELADTLDESARATDPSKKSEVERRIARDIREVLREFEP